MPWTATPTNPTTSAAWCPTRRKARAVDEVHGARHGLTGAHADTAHALRLPPSAWLPAWLPKMLQSPAAERGEAP